MLRCINGGAWPNMSQTPGRRFNVVYGSEPSRRPGSPDRRPLTIQMTAAALISRIGTKGQIPPMAAAGAAMAIAEPGARAVSRAITTAPM